MIFVTSTICSLPFILFMSLGYTEYFRWFTIILQSESMSLLLLSEYLVEVKQSRIVHASAVFAQLINIAEDVPLFTQMSFSQVVKLSRINIVFEIRILILRAPLVLSFSNSSTPNVLTNFLLFAESIQDLLWNLLCGFCGCET